MVKEKPPRVRLIAPDSDDEGAAAPTPDDDAAEAENTGEEEEEVVSEGKVDFKSVAERLRTVIPVPEEDGVVEPDAFVPILEALEELKSVNLVTHPQFSTEIEKTKIIDMLFAILDKNRPNAVVVADKNKTPNDDKENEDGNADGATESPEEVKELSFEEKQSERLNNHRRVIYDTWALPVVRILARLTSSNPSFRKEIGKEVLKLRTAATLLQPGLLSIEKMETSETTETPEDDSNDDSNPKRIKRPPQLKQDCLFEASLRLLSSVGSSSTLASQSICKLIAGVDETTLSSGSVWFRQLLENKDDRVVAKAARLMATVTRTKSNRDRLFRASNRVSGIPKSNATDDVLVSQGKPEESVKNVEDDNNAKLLSAVYEVFKSSPNPLARKNCAVVLASACADIGDDSVRFNYLKLEEPEGKFQANCSYAVADALARSVLYDPDCDVRLVAGNALLGLTQRHAPTAKALGEKDFACALFSTFPSVSEEWPEVVVPPADEKGEGEDGEEKEGEAVESEDVNEDEAGDADAYLESSPVPSIAPSSTSTAVTISGHNLFTSHFGIRPVGYTSPPPRVRPVRGMDDECESAGNLFYYTDGPMDDPEEPSVRPAIRVAEGDHHPVFPVALKLYASIIDNHAPSRLAEAGKCCWPVSYLRKVGNVLVKPPNELTERDLNTPLTYLRTLLRPCAPFVEPDPTPAFESEPLTEEELAVVEEKKQWEAEEKEQRRTQRHLDGYDTSESDNDTYDPVFTESFENEEERTARLDLEFRTRIGERLRYQEDSKKHNENTRAGALAIFRALIDEPGFCKAVSCVELYPDAIGRIITAIPSNFDSIEEGARFLVKLGDNAQVAVGDIDAAFGDDTVGDGIGDNIGDTMDTSFGDIKTSTLGGTTTEPNQNMDPKTPVKSKLREQGIVDALRGVSKTIEQSKKSSPKTFQLSRVSKMAHEAALLVFPEKEFVPTVKPPVLTTFYKTTPPPPKQPAPTWRLQATRNVDDAETRTVVLADDNVDDAKNDTSDLSQSTVIPPYLLHPIVPGVKILPRHVPFPEVWQFRGDTGAPLGLIALKERMLRCVRGAPTDEAEKIEEEMSVAESSAASAAAAVEDAARDAKTACVEKVAAFQNLEAAERAAQVLESEDSIAARHAGVTKATSKEERFAMTANFEVIEGERKVAKRRVELARAEYAAKSLASQIVASVFRKERDTLLKAEQSFASLKMTNKEPDLVGPWSLDTWNEAVEKWATTNADPRDGPPVATFCGLKFLVALLTGVESAVECFTTPEYTTVGGDEEGVKDGADRVAETFASIGAPPSQIALQKHKLKCDAKIWNDEEGVLRTTLKGTGEHSLASKMEKFVTEALWDFDVDEMERAKAAFLKRVYVKDAEAESPAAGRLLKFCYSAARHVEVLGAKQRRKEVMKRMQGAARKAMMALRSAGAMKKEEE